MPTINEKLSNWDALHYCFCHRWQWQPSPAHSPEGICYERPGTQADAYRHPRRRDPVIPPRVFTWRAIDEEGKPRRFEWVGPERCSCGYDLTRTPRQNIKAISAEEWSAGVVINTCLAHEGAAVDILPADVEIEFGGCNLDNAVLSAKHRMLGSRKDHRATTCSHNRIIRQNDGREWVCRWKSTAEKAADTPTSPLDLKASLLQGLNVDPALIPAKPLTAEQIEEDDRARQRWEARVQNAKVYVAEDGWTPCTCIAERQATIEARLGRSVPIAKVMPLRTCPTCGGCGALPPAAAKAGG